LSRHSQGLPIVGARPTGSAIWRPTHAHTPLRNPATSPKCPTEHLPRTIDTAFGRVQLGLRRAAIVAPDREWSTRELMEWTHTMPLYRSGNSYRARLTASRSVRRACQKLATRIGRRWPDGILWRARRAAKAQSGMAGAAVICKNPWPWRHSRADAVQTQRGRRAKRRRGDSSPRHRTTQQQVAVAAIAGAAAAAERGRIDE
jgi:hypothetical protein